MTEQAPGSDGSRGASRGERSGRARSTGRRAGRVVISSLTGKPIPWDDDQQPGADGDRANSARRGDEPRVIPDRASEDAPEAGERAGHDAEILRDVPPHWGTGA